MVGGACALVPCAENLNLQISQVWITSSGWRDGLLARRLGGGEGDALLRPRGLRGAEGNVAIFATTIARWLSLS